MRNPPRNLFSTKADKSESKGNGEIPPLLLRWFFFLGGPLNHNRPRIPTWADRSMNLTLTGQPDRIPSHGNETYTDLELTCRNKYLGFFREKE